VGTGTPLYYAWTPAGPLAQRTGTDSSSRRYYAVDLHSDVVGVANTSGSLVGTRLFRPWGEVLSQTGEMTTPPTQGTLGFQSDLTDATTGQVDMLARNYEPTLGRFDTRDVLFGDPASPSSLNLSVYAQDDPVTYSDPTGLCPIPWECPSATGFGGFHSQGWVATGQAHTRAEESRDEYQPPTLSQPGFDYLEAIARLLPRIRLPLPTISLPSGIFSLEGEYVGPDYFNGSRWSLAFDMVTGSAEAASGPLKVRIDDLAGQVRAALLRRTGSAGPVHGTVSIGTQSVSATGRMEVSVALKSNWFERNVLGWNRLEVRATATVDVVGGGQVTVSLVGSIESDRVPPWLAVPGGLLVGGAAWAIRTALQGCGGAPCPVPA
jgi:RHS repeat-associated protein